MRDTTKQLQVKIDKKYYYRYSSPFKDIFGDRSLHSSESANLYNSMCATFDLKKIIRNQSFCVSDSGECLFKHENKYFTFLISQSCLINSVYTGHIITKNDKKSESGSHLLLGLTGDVIFISCSFWKLLVMKFGLLLLFCFNLGDFRDDLAFSSNLNLLIVYL